MKSVEFNFVSPFEDKSQYLKQNTTPHHNKDQLVNAV
jgi:hypothetical protein